MVTTYRHGPGPDPAPSGPASRGRSHGSPRRSPAAYQPEPSLNWHAAVDRHLAERYRSQDPVLPCQPPPDTGERVGARDELTRQLHLAERLQRSILPEHVSVPGLDVYTHLQAASYVGGDFYDVHPLPGRRCGLVVGDVCGRGIPAALLMMLTVGVLREVSHLGNGPAEILALANRRVRACLPDDPYQAYVTASYCLLDLEAGRIAFSSAGHPPPLLRHARNGTVTPLVTHGFFLGLFDDATYEQGETALAAGDQVVLCTDGILESRNQHGDLFDSDRLARFLAQGAAMPCHEMGPRVLQAVAAFRREPAATDDVALLIAEVGRDAG